jgi:hypothetical protein
MQAQALEHRVVHAAEAALADHHYVSPIDVLCGMGVLAPSNIKAWRRGRIDYLEKVIQGNLSKISQSMKTLRKWARDKGLKPSETRYLRQTRGGATELRFSVSGNPEIETAYRTHFVSPALADAKRRKLEERLSAPPERVVFEIVRDSSCSECGAELWKGNMLTMEGDQALCLACAGLAELEFLPAGDAALTRRAAKHSQAKVVVVRFSRTRGRYERREFSSTRRQSNKPNRSALRTRRKGHERGLDPSNRGGRRIAN